MNIGQLIQKLRTDTNMTQEGLAGELFVSRDLVSKWENNIRRPDYSAIQKLAEIFNVDVQFFVNSGNIILNELSECIDMANNYDNKSLEIVLNAFLRTLSEFDCRIFVHRYYLFEATKEIAVTLGTKDGTVRSSLSRTRKKLKKYLSEEYNNE